MAHAGANTRSGGEAEIITILLIGKTGAGKSTLGNVLLGYDGDSPEAPFATSASVHSKTVAMKQVDGHFCGNPERPIRVIDCPGFADSEGRDDQFASELSNIMETVGHLDVLLWCRNGQENRYDVNERAQLRTCLDIFGMYLFGNMVMNLSKWGHDERSKNLRQRAGNDFPNVRQQIWELVTESVVGKRTAFPIYTLDAMYVKSSEDEDKAFNDMAEEMWYCFVNLSMKPAFTKKTLEEYEAKKKAEEAEGRKPTIDPVKEEAKMRSCSVEIPWWWQTMNQILKFVEIGKELWGLSTMFGNRGEKQGVDAAFGSPSSHIPSSGPRQWGLTGQDPFNPFGHSHGRPSHWPPSPLHGPPSHCKNM